MKAVNRTMRQRGSRHRIVAEATDQREVDRHHRDLPELRERERAGEPDRFGQLAAPNARPRRRVDDGALASHRLTIAVESGRGSGRWPRRFATLNRGAPR
jgi:hypothetical protein